MNKKFTKVVVVLFMLALTQLFFIEIIPAYADSYWNAEGKILPHGKVIVKDLPHYKIKTEHRIILHYRHNDNITQTQTQQILASINMVQNFALNGTVDGIGYDGPTPPDVQIAAGPVNIMEMVNIEGQIWTKAGVPQGPPFDLASLFGTGFDSISDPKVIYDAQSERWFSSLTDLTTSTVKVAVSDTSDASGGFCIYNMTGPSSLLLDQPIIGVSDDKFVVSTNNMDLYSGKLNYTQFWILNKNEMLSCSPIDIVTRTTNDYFSIHPVQSLTGTRTQYMVSTSHTDKGSFVNVFSINGVPPDRVWISVKRLEVSSISNPPSAIQNGASLALDTGDYRVLDAVWSDDMLWLAHNNGCVPLNDTAQRSCLHLVEINTDRMKVKQDFDYGQTGKYLFYPALQEFPNGNVFVVFGFSSPVDYPGIYVTEQAVTDPVNSLESPILVQAGQAPVDEFFSCPDSVCRYGDYFGAGLDPNNPEVWVAGEYGSGIQGIAGTAWGTKIAHFTNK